MLAPTTPKQEKMKIHWESCPDCDDGYRYDNGDVKCSTCSYWEDFPNSCAKPFRERTWWPVGATYKPDAAWHVQAAVARLSEALGEAKGHLSEVRAIQKRAAEK